MLLVIERDRFAGKRQIEANTKLAGALAQKASGFVCRHRGKIVDVLVTAGTESHPAIAGHFLPGPAARLSDLNHFEWFVWHETLRGHTTRPRVK